MAYPNKLFIEGRKITRMADPNGSGIAAWIRCKYAAASGATPDGSPILQICSATERAVAVTAQPVAAGAYAVCFLPAGDIGLMGIMVGSCTEGDLLYAAANGKLSTSSAGGALATGRATCSGANGGTVTYEPLSVAA